MSTDKPKIILVLDNDIINRIDDYRYGNRVPSRSEAIRRLILEALQKFENLPKKKSWKASQILHGRFFICVRLFEK